ncbi:MAG: hypothetical protein AABY15_06780 [Nanoarchaeota archaeon]
MEDVTIPCKNTAKMLGANSLEALNFGDACFVLVNNISKDLKEKARKTILATVLHGKTFERWLEDIYSVGKKYNTLLVPADQSQLMTMEETKKTFSYHMVKEILSTLTTKQFHEKAA